MDLLKGLSPGGQVLWHFDNIHYCVYSCLMNEAGNASKAPSRDSSKSNVLHKTCNDLRKERRFVTVDYHRHNLWIFCKTDLREAQPVPDQIHIVHSASVQLAELLNQDAHVIKPPQNSYHDWTLVEVYKHFILACYELMSFDIVTPNLCLPLNLRTYMMRQDEDSRSISRGNNDRYALAHISLSITSGGLVHTTFISDRNKTFRTLELDESRNAALSAFRGHCPVHLAPSGRLAYFSAQSDRPRPAWLQQIKVAFLDLLADRGLVLDEKTSWIVVHIPKGDKAFDTLGNITSAYRFPRPNDMVLIWPASLCFWTMPHDDLRLPGDTTVLKSGVQLDPLLDPIDFALDWLGTAQMRQSSIQQMRPKLNQSKSDKPTIERMLNEFGVIDSPTETVIPSFLEGQNIYPTPSDGFSTYVSPNNTEGVDARTLDTSSPQQSLAGAQDAGDIVDIMPDDSQRTKHENPISNQPLILSPPASTKLAPCAKSTARFLQDAAQRKRQINKQGPNNSSTVVSLDPESPIAINGKNAVNQNAQSSAESRNPVASGDLTALAPRYMARLDVPRTISGYSNPTAAKLDSQVSRSQIANPSISKRETVFSPTSVHGSRQRPWETLQSPSTYAAPLSPADSDNSESDDASSEFHTGGSWKKRRLDETHEGQRGQIPMDTFDPAFPITSQVPLRSALDLLVVQIFCTTASTMPINPDYGRSNDVKWVPCERNSNVKIAQSLTEQLSYCTVHSTRRSSPNHNNLRNSAEIIFSKLSSVFESGYGYNTVEGRVQQPFPELALGLTDGNESEINQIAWPMIKTRRSDEPWECMSSGAAFWETLGLEPVGGEKDVYAYYIIPDDLQLDDALERLQDTLSDTWIAQRLGTHSTASLPDGGEDGIALVPVSGSGNSRVKILWNRTREVCRLLGVHIGGNYSSDQRIVVYMVNPSDNPASRAALCGFFVHLIDTVRSGRRRAGANIILKILPLESIVHPAKSAFWNSRTAVRLAHEVYGRFPPLNDRFLISSGASIILASPAKTSVRLVLTNDLLSESLLEPATMHVAYCVSSNDTWVTAAWTDTTGETQHVASYRITSKVSLGDILGEILNTSVEIVKVRRMKWKMCITKTSPFLAVEELQWQHLASLVQDSKLPPITMQLLVVDQDPYPLATFKVTEDTLQDKPTPSPLPTSAQHASSQYHHTQDAPSTPIATPNPNFPSPAALYPFATPATPSAYDPAAPQPEVDPNAQLIDKTAECWAIVSGHLLNVSDTPLAYRPALASGFVMKRTGVFPTDPPALLGVNLCWVGEVGVKGQQISAGVNREEAVKILKSVLTDFGRLEMLAKLRWQEGVDSVRPWHVAAAVKSVEGLERCMREVVWVGSEKKGELNVH